MKIEILAIIATNVVTIVGIASKRQVIKNEKELH
jgi:hypothetical protein